MIRILEQKIIEGDKVYINAAGLSTDSKPTAGLVTGSVFVEVNSGKTFLFNEAAGAWVEQGGSK